MEDNHGHDPISVDSCDSSGNNGEVCLKKGKSFLVIDRHFVTSTVLSIGTASALIVFAIQACKHPDSAGLLGTVVLAPILQLAIKLIRRECPNCKQGKKDGEQEG